MNDFTKKELMALEDAMEQMLMDYVPQGGESPLLKKLQSMIENYCEHENDTAFNAIPMDGAPKMCKKCGGFWI